MVRNEYAVKSATLEIDFELPNIEMAMEAYIQSMVDKIRIDAIASARDRAIRANIFNIVSISHSVVNIPRDSTSVNITVVVVYNFV